MLVDGLGRQRELVFYGASTVKDISAWRNAVDENFVINKHFVWNFPHVPNLDQDFTLSEFKVKRSRSFFLPTNLKQYNNQSQNSKHYDSVSRNVRDMAS